MTHRWMNTFTIREDRINDHVELVGDLAQQDADAVAVTGGVVADTTNTSIETGVVAAGTVLGDATAVTKQTVIVATTAASTGISLPTAVAGMEMFIVNSGVNSLLIYANTADQIDGGASITLATTKTTIVKSVDGTDWYSFPSA